MDWARRVGGAEVRRAEGGGGVRAGHGGVSGAGRLRGRGARSTDRGAGPGSECRSGRRRRAGGEGVRRAAPRSVRPVGRGRGGQPGHGWPAVAGATGGRRVWPGGRVAGRGRHGRILAIDRGAGPRASRPDPARPDRGAQRDGARPVRRAAGPDPLGQLRSRGRRRGGGPGPRARLPPRPGCALDRGARRRAGARTRPAWPPRRAVRQRRRPNSRSC